MAGKKTIYEGTKKEHLLGRIREIYEEEREPYVVCVDL